MKSTLQAFKVLILAAGCCLAVHSESLHGTPTGRAGEVSQIEARLASLALEKSQSPVVREHAEKTLAESGALFQRLAILAEERNIPMASGPTAAQEAEFQKIAAMPESAFDTAYFQQQDLAAREIYVLAVEDKTDPALRTILADYQTALHEMEAAGR